jgi:hypothetical protein
VYQRRGALAGPDDFGDVLAAGVSVVEVFDRKTRVVENDG